MKYYLDVKIIEEDDSGNTSVFMHECSEAFDEDQADLVIDLFHDISFNPKSLLDYNV